MLQRRDTWLAIGIVAFAAFLLFGLIPFGVTSPSNIRVRVQAPTFWPNIIAAGLLLGGVLLLLQQRFLREADSVIDDATGIPGSPWVRILFISILMLLYYLAIPFLGMVFASMLAIAAFCLMVNTKHRVAALVVSVMLPLAVYAFFSHVAGVPVPQGEFIRLP